MGNEQSKEPCPENSEPTGPGISDPEEPPICKIEPNLDQNINKIASRKRKRVDDDVIYISDDDDITLIEDICEPIKTVQPEVEPEVIDLINDNTEKDDSNTDSDASPIKHHRTDSAVESMEVDEVKKSLFPVDPKYECSVSIYNCNADDIQELQVSQVQFFIRIFYFVSIVAPAC